MHKMWIKKKLSVIISGIMIATMIWTGNVRAAGSNCGGLEEVDVFYPEKDDVIQDPALHWAIRAAMNATGQKLKLTKEDVGSSYVKYISYEQSSHPENFVDWKMPWYVESLEGLQYAKSAKQIDIGYTAYKEGMKIKDLSPISGLTQLEQLFLKGDGLTDISAIKNLTNLYSLWLNENQIKDISAVADMKKLTQLSLIRNQVSDVTPIKELSNLRTLDLSYNPIKELPDMSGLKSLTSLDLSDIKELTDISPLEKVKSLQRLSLTGDSGITDIKPLAELTLLDKEQTYLPDNTKKDDLFAAIAVNKYIDEFSISNMTSGDLKLVQKALDAYDKLTDEQKSYIKAGKIDAIKSNKEKVEKGETPDAYPEFENTAEQTPIWDRLEIKVINKNGIPLEGVKFVKEKIREFPDEPDEVAKDELVSDENGMLIIKHKDFDAIYDKITIKPADGQKTTPEEISYTVTYGAEGGPTRVTQTVNGVKATGKEKLQFILSEEGEEEARQTLETAFTKANEKVNAKEGYRYTEETWTPYESLLKKAENMLNTSSGTVAQMQQTAKELEEALQGLKKTDKLTTLKLTIRDKKGKHIGRAFKFQIRDINNPSHAWNEYTDADTGVAYIEVSPGWSTDTTWEVRACVQETLEMEPIRVTTAQQDRSWYFKTIDGKPASVDFEKQVSVWPKTDGKPDVDKETVSATQVKLSKTTFTYNGKKQQPKLTVKNKAGKAIASSDYKTQFSSGCKNVGQYTVKITFSGNYKGTVTKTFTIDPKGTSLKSVKAGKKSFTANWKAQKTQTSGYQLQYSTNKKLAKAVKTSTISKNTTVKKTVKKLSAKKTYYVRVRTYKTVKVGKKSVKIYSGWSAAKKVKTK